MEEVRKSDGVTYHRRSPMVVRLNKYTMHWSEGNPTKNNKRVAQRLPEDDTIPEEEEVQILEMVDSVIVEAFGEVTLEDGTYVPYERKEPFDRKVKCKYVYDHNPVGKYVSMRIAEGRFGQKIKQYLAKHAGLTQPMYTKLRMTWRKAAVHFSPVPPVLAVKYTKTPRKALVQEWLNQQTEPLPDDYIEQISKFVGEFEGGFMTKLSDFGSNFIGSFNHARPMIELLHKGLEKIKSLAVKIMGFLANPIIHVVAACVAGILISKFLYEIFVRFANWISLTDMYKSIVDYLAPGYKDYSSGAETDPCHRPFGVTLALCVEWMLKTLGVIGVSATVFGLIDYFNTECNVDVTTFTPAEGVEVVGSTQAIKCPIIPIISLITGAVVTGNMPTAPLATRALTFIKMTTAALTIGSLLSTITTYLYTWAPDMIKGWVNAIYGVPPGTAMDTPEAKAWMFEALTVIDTVSKSTSALRDDPSLKERIEDLYYSGMNMRKDLEVWGASRAEIEEFNNQYKKIVVLQRGIWAASGQAPVRQCPVVVYLYGGSQIGKSTLLKDLAKDALKMENYDSIYARNASSEYWDGYARHRAVLFEDYAQLVSNKEPNMLFGLVSVNQYLPNFASTDDYSVGKKGEPFVGELILLASNLPPDVDHNGIADQNALRNRYHVCVQAQVLSRYVKNSAIHWPSVTKDITPINKAPHLMFTLVNPHTGRIMTNQGNPIRYNYRQLVVLTRKYLDVHKADHARALLSTTADSKWLTPETRMVIQNKVVLVQAVMDGLLKPVVNQQHTIERLLALDYTQTEELTNLMSVWDRRKLMKAAKLNVFCTRFEAALYKNATAQSMWTGDMQMAMDLGQFFKQMKDANFYPPVMFVPPNRKDCVSLAKVFGVRQEGDQFELDVDYWESKYDPVHDPFNRPFVPDEYLEDVDFDNTQSTYTTTKRNLEIGLSVAKNILQVEVGQSASDTSSIVVLPPPVDTTVSAPPQMTTLQITTLKPVVGTQEMYLGPYGRRQPPPPKPVTDPRLDYETAYESKMHSMFSMDAELPAYTIETAEAVVTPPPNPHPPYSYMDWVKKKWNDSVVKWWRSLSDRARTILKSVAIIATLAGLVLAAYKLYHWNDIISDVGEVEKSRHGLERSQMINLISLVTKDVNEQLGSMPMDSLRHVCMLRLEEAGYDPSVDKPLSELLTNATMPVKVNELMCKQMWEATKEMDESTLSLMPDSLFTMSMSTPINELKKVKDNMLGVLDLTVTENAAKAAALLRVSPRVYGLVANPDIMPDFPSLRTLSVEGATESQTKSRSASSRRKVIAKKYGDRRGFRGSLQSGSQLPTFEYAKFTHMETGSSLHGIPINSSNVLIPLHFFTNMKVGSVITMEWRKVSFKFQYDPEAISALRTGKGVPLEIVLYTLPSYIPALPNQESLFPYERDLPIGRDLDNPVCIVQEGIIIHAKQALMSRNSGSFENSIKTMAQIYVVSPEQKFKPGGCGLPIFARMEHGMLIAGMHVFHASSTGDDIAVTVTREHIDKLLKGVKVHINETAEPKGGMEGNMGNFEYISFCPTKESTQETVLKPSKLAAAYPPSLHEPAPLVSADKRIHKKLRPDIYKEGKTLMQAQVAKFSNCNPPYPIEHRSFAVSAQIHEYMMCPFPHERRELTWHEAINGYHNLKKINMNSSPGYTAKHKFQVYERKFLFEWTPEGWNMKKRLEEWITPLYEQVVAGIIPDIRWSDALKDELRPSEKVSAAKTRTFTIMDITGLLIVRKILGAFMAFRLGIKNTTSSAVGVNPYSPDWNDMFKYLRVAGSNGYDWDWSSFDGDIGAEEWEDDMHVAIAWYSMKGPISYLMERNIRIAYYLLQHRTTYNSGWWYRIHTGNGSGGPMTALINTAVNDRRNKMVWYEFAPNTPGMQRHSLKDMLQHVRAKMLGDDSIVAVSSDYLKVYIPSKVQSWHAKFGRKITGADKTGVVDDKPKKLVDLDFISLQSRSTDGSNITENAYGIEFKAVPNWKIFDKCLKWCKRGASITADENAILRCDAIAWQLSGYTRTEYESFITKMVEAAHQYLPEFARNISVPTYDELQNAYMTHAIVLEDECMHESGPYMGWCEMLRSPGATFISKEYKIESVEKCSGVNVLPAQGGSVSKPVAKPSKPISLPPRNLTLEELMCRPVKIASTTWTMGQPIYTSIWSAKAPFDLINKANHLKTPFQKFRFFRFDMKIMVTVSSTKFHSGLLRLYWAPLISRSCKEANIQINRSAVSFLEGVDVGPNETAVLEVPWRYQRDMMSTVDAKVDSLGMFSLDVFSCLRTGSADTEAIKKIDATVVISLSLVNPKFAVPKGIPGVLQGVVSSKVMNLTIAGDRNAVPTDIEGDEYDMEQEFSSMDNPALNVSPIPCLVRGVPPFNYSEGVEFMDKFALHPRYMAVTRKAHYSDATDVMSIATLASRPSYMTSFLWKTSELSGRLLEWGYISPTDTRFHSRLNVPNEMCAIEFVSKHFNVWSGTIHLTFRVVATEMHTGSLVVTIHYGLLLPPLTLEAAMQEYSTTFAIGEKQHTLEVEIPFVSDTEKKFIVNSGSLDTLSCTGVWAVWVQNELRCPEMCAPVVDVLVSKRGGTDFRVFGLGCGGRMYKPLIGSCQIDPATDKVLAPESPPVKVELKDAVLSLRDVARRYNRIPDIPLPATDPKTPKLTDVPIAYMPTQSLAQYVCPQYNDMWTGWRGTLRVRLIAPPGFDVSMYFVPQWNPTTELSPSALLAFSKSLKVISQDTTIPIALTSHVDHVRYLEAEIPFITPYNFLLLHEPISAKTSTGMVVIVCDYATATTADKILKAYVSGGDDFRFGILRGVPIITTDPTRSIVDNPDTLRVRLPKRLVIDYSTTPSNVCTWDEPIQATPIEAKTPTTMVNNMWVQVKLVMIDLSEQPPALLVAMGVLRTVADFTGAGFDDITVDIKSTNYKTPYVVGTTTCFLPRILRLMYSSKETVITMDWSTTVQAHGWKEPILPASGKGTIRDPTTRMLYNTAGYVQWEMDTTNDPVAYLCQNFLTVGGKAVKDQKVLYLVDREYEMVIATKESVKSITMGNYGIWSKSTQEKDIGVALLDAVNRDADSLYYLPGNAKLPADQGVNESEIEFLEIESDYIYDE